VLTPREFENERVRAGLKRAVDKTLGRPRISAKKESAVRQALSKGDIGIRKIARTLGIGTGTVQRIRAEMAAQVH
jgi:DNA invertase Pin-like site-specific DNA recombinase